MRCLRFAAMRRCFRFIAKDYWIGENDSNPFGLCAIFLLLVECFRRLSPNGSVAAEADEVRQERPVGSTKRMSAAGMTPPRRSNGLMSVGI